MTATPERRDADDRREVAPGRGDDADGDHLDPEGLEAGVDDVIEFFDREPPEHPVSDSDVQPPPG